VHARLLPVTVSHDDRVFLDGKQASREIVGRDPKILEVLALIERVADSQATVLIEGESGTGKELIARALHYESARRDGPFVAINCAAIPESLLESELLGHERGAFTGAADRRIGKIEQAHGGTLFLDEVSELAYPLQAKLLRVLQANEFQRLGGRETIRVDVRTVAASSRDLRALTCEGKFQEALYYRLNVIPLRLPALRDRKDDIPLLADRFFDKYTAMYGRRLRAEPEVREWLREYPFPGNVRELENLVHRLVLLARDDVVRLGDLPAELLGAAPRRMDLAKDPIERLFRTPPADLAEVRRRRQEVQRLLAEQERELVERSLREAGGNVTRAASRLGVHRVTLHKIVRRAAGERGG
jgi:two-component system nitrogen regulation response regulator GlnG